MTKNSDMDTNTIVNSIMGRNTNKTNDKLTIIFANIQHFGYVFGY